MDHTVTAVNGLDRVAINTRLHYINEELLKLRTKQSELVAMRDELDRVEAPESADDCDNLFEQMFGYEEAA